MYANKYKHAWYWFRNVWNFGDFEKQNNFVWMMVKPMASCKVLTLTTLGIFGFTAQNCVCVLKILTFQRLFQELLNQYPACLYLTECMCHCGSKYDHEILQFWPFFPKKIVKFLTCRINIDVNCFSQLHHHLLHQLLIWDTCLQMTPWTPCHHRQNSCRHQRIQNGCLPTM